MCTLKLLTVNIFFGRFPKYKPLNPNLSNTNFTFLLIHHNTVYIKLNKLLLKC